MTFLHCENMSAIASGHVLDVLRHLQRQVVLGDELGVAVLELNEMLLKLVVAETARCCSWWGRTQCRIPNCADAVPTQSTDGSKQATGVFFFIGLFPFLPSQIGRHFVVVVIGQRKIAREINFDAVPLADRDGRQNVQEFVENLRGGLRRALRESLAHEVAPGCGECAACSCFGHGSESTDGERNAEDAEVVVVHLVAKSRCRRSGRGP